jgi:hypothetical protein
LGAHFGEREFSKGSSFSEEGKDKIQGEENPRTPTLESLQMASVLVWSPNVVLPYVQVVSSPLV